MTVTKTILTALATSLVLALPAAAQGRGDASGRVDTEFTFDDGDDVEGRRVGAEGVIVPGRHRLRRRSLVRPRTHFVPEMLKTVETL